MAIKENSMEDPPKKKKIEVPFVLAIPILDIYPKTTKSLS